MNARDLMIGDLVKHRGKIKKIVYINDKFYNIQCDCCGEIINENWYNNPDDAKTEADQDSFILELGGRHYCPRCYRHDDDDNIITSDCRKFDGETMEELDNSDYFVSKATENCMPYHKARVVPRKQYNCSSDSQTSRDARYRDARKERM